MAPPFSFDQSASVLKRSSSWSAFTPRSRGRFEALRLKQSTSSPAPIRNGTTLSDFNPNHSTSPSASAGRFTGALVSTHQAKPPAPLLRSSQLSPPPLRNDATESTRKTPAARTPTTVKLRDARRLRFTLAKPSGLSSPKEPMLPNFFRKTPNPPNKTPKPIKKNAPCGPTAKFIAIPPPTIRTPSTIRTMENLLFVPTCSSAPEFKRKLALCLACFRVVNQTESKDKNTIINNPVTTVPELKCRSKTVPPAPQIDPITFRTRAQNPIARIAPKIAPISTTKKASPKRQFEIFLALIPTAASSAPSSARCSTLKRKSIVTRAIAERIRKKLIERKSIAKSTGDLAASLACAEKSCKCIPANSGSRIFSTCFFTAS